MNPWLCNSKQPFARSAGVMIAGSMFEIFYLYFFFWIEGPPKVVCGILGFTHVRVPICRIVIGLISGSSSVSVVVVPVAGLVSEGCGTSRVWLRIVGQGRVN